MNRDLLSVIAAAGAFGALVGILLDVPKSSSKWTNTLGQWSQNRFNGLWDWFLKQVVLLDQGSEYLNCLVYIWKARRCLFSECIASYTLSRFGFPMSISIFAFVPARHQALFHFFFARYRLTRPDVFWLGCLRPDIVYRHFFPPTTCLFGIQEFRRSLQTSLATCFGLYLRSLCSSYIAWISLVATVICPSTSSFDFTTLAVCGWIVE